MQRKAAELFSRAEKRNIAGGELWLWHRGEFVFYSCYGKRAILPEELPWQEGLILDVASLTKPLVTGLLSLLLMEKERIEPSSRISQFIPELPLHLRDITLLQLATHTSGLPSWAPLYRKGGGREAMLRELFSLPLQDRDRPVYSCPGYILLGLVVERLAGMSLAEAASRLLFSPLGLKSAFFNPPSPLKEKIVPTELGNKYERRKAGEVSVKMREELIWGQVHDGNSYYWGGDAGNAGAFLDREAIVGLANAFIEPGFLLERNKDLALKPLRREWSWGWKVRDGILGHTGFTGGYLLISPSKKAVGFFYLNRTHPEVVEDISDLREEFLSLFLEFLRQI